MLNFKLKHNFLKNSFFLSTISEWNKLNTSHNPEEIKLITRLPLHKKWGFPLRISSVKFSPHLLKKFIMENFIFLFSVRLGFSHLSKHKFKYNFQEFLNPLCDCVASETHFFLHSLLFTNERYTLLSTISSIDCNLLNNTDFLSTQTLSFGNLSFNSNKNLETLNATIDYILSTKRFDEALF